MFHERNAQPSKEEKQMHAKMEKRTGYVIAFDSKTGKGKIAQDGGHPDVTFYVIALVEYGKETSMIQVGARVEYFFFPPGSRSLIRDIRTMS